MQKSISPAFIEPVTTTANQRYDPEAGVNQRSEPNPSILCRRLRESDLSQIEISGDIVLQEDPHQPRSNRQIQSSQPNTNSNLLRDETGVRLNAEEASTSPRNLKNNCCTIS